ncbi:MAG TPA: hypothetical protein DCM71_10075 [Runella sp.]|nr:hypothetical protein [Runella sp.]
MRDVISMFHERVTEIELYFSFLEDIMLNNSEIIFENDNRKKISHQLSQTLRANGFLLLYNLVESSMSLSVEAIHKEFTIKQISYDTLSNSVKTEIFKYLQGKNVKVENFIKNVENIVFDILKFPPQPRDIFSGNVDAREIKRISEKYGFSCKTNAKKTSNGSKLLTVKSRRNDLAHGFISFQECGKEYSIQDLILIKKEVIAYISEILNNIQEYLDNRMYLK